MSQCFDSLHISITHFLAMNYLECHENAEAELQEHMKHRLSDDLGYPQLLHTLGFQFTKSAVVGTNILNWYFKMFCLPTKSSNSNMFWWMNVRLVLLLAGCDCCRLIAFNNKLTTFSFVVFEGMLFQRQTENWVVLVGAENLAWISSRSHLYKQLYLDGRHIYYHESHWSYVVSCPLEK